MLSWIDADGQKLLLARALRAFSGGYLGVILALYLEALGLDLVSIGMVLTASIAGSAVMTVLWSFVADVVGRRRTAAIMALLMAVGGLVFAAGANLWLLLLVAFTVTISATTEVGAFSTVNQAMLPQTAADEGRTMLFAVYNMLGNFAGAAGSLAAGLVGLFEARGLTGAAAYRPLLVLYALIGVANLVLFLGLSPRVEMVRVEARRRFLGIHRSAGRVAALSLLFGLDAFAGGFVVDSLVAYWFHVRWGMEAGSLGVVFFWVGILSGLSLLAAGWLARRIGLLNTMVFTHLPSNLLLILVPLAPSAPLAVAAFLARMSISQMDVPTRQSYTMAIVGPDERTAAAGLTSVARIAASAVAPAFTGLVLANPALGLPFHLAGALKALYDGLLYVSFRRVRPPEEAPPRVLVPSGPAPHRLK